MKESFLLAVSQLRGDRFRTLLSLLGVTVGIFSIVAVFTLVDSLHGAIDESFEKYGTDILFVEPAPIEPDLNEDGEFRWWEYAGRPRVSYSEYQYLAQNAPDADIAFKCKTDDGVIGVSEGWELIVQDELALGRGITPAEASGSFVAMIGSNVRDERFKGDNPIGRKVRLYGHDFVVVGAFAPSGSNLVSTVDTDNSYIVPYKALESLVDVSGCNTNITIRGLDVSEVRTLMRQSRRTPPYREDDFAVNRFSFVLSEITDIFGLIDTLGWIVGIFSLLVGGFGIANIMFVSVQERKPEIGIQKALGAKSTTIVFQYLSEAVFLSLIGGAAGIALVSLIPAFIPQGLITVRLGIDNIVLGLAISLALGVAAGVSPARRAAALHPAEAINSI